MKYFFYLLLFSKIIMCDNGIIDLKLEVRDLVEGEYMMGGNKLFNLVIENKGDKDIILATGTASPWLYYSGFWEVDIRGPIDRRCREYEHPTVEEPAPYPYFPSIEIKANSVYKTQLILLGVGEVGRYEVTVKYNGEKVGDLCGYCLKENISSKRYSFEIKAANGVDREVIDLWKSRNKEKPFCLFPLGMKNEEILSKFPTSTYAGWVLAPFFYNKAPFRNGKQIIENAILPEEKRDLKIRMKEKGKDGKYIYLSSEEYALRYIDLAEQFIKANKGDKNLGAIYAGLSLCYMYLREWDKAYKYGEKSLELDWPIWIYSAYLPDLENQRGVLKEALEEMLKRGLVKKN